MNNRFILLCLKNIILVIVSASMGAFISYAGDLYTCKESGGGAIVWQDVPCRAGEEIEHRNLHNYLKENDSKKGHGELTAAIASKLIRNNNIDIGMSRKDVIKSLGEPDRIDVLVTPLGTIEKFTYDRFSPPVFVKINEKENVSSFEYGHIK